MHYRETRRSNESRTSPAVTTLRDMGSITTAERKFKNDCSGIHEQRKLPISNSYTTGGSVWSTKRICEGAEILRFSGGPTQKTSLESAGTRETGVETRICARLPIVLTLQLPLVTLGLRHMGARSSVVERSAHNRLVVGSNPAEPTTGPFGSATFHFTGPCPTWETARMQLAR